MSDLIAVAYPNQGIADEVHETSRLSAERVIQLAAAVIVTPDQGGSVRPLVLAPSPVVRAR